MMEVQSSLHLHLFGQVTYYTLRLKHTKASSSMFYSLSVLDSCSCAHVWSLVTAQIEHRHMCTALSLVTARIEHSIEPMHSSYVDGCTLTLYRE